MKKNFKKFLAVAMATTMVFAAGCGSSETETTTAGAADTTAADTTAADTSADTTAADTAAAGMTGPITVVSREDGSGTRGAFIELFGVEVKDDAGNKTDQTTTEAVIANKTDVMMTNVASDPQAIGYSSLGSLNDTVKALKINGVEATSENVASGTYEIARPFNIVTKDDLSDAAKDFMSYVMSAEGQEVVGETYVKADDAAAAYAKSDATGKVVVTGSSSVSPVMEKLIEAYSAVNSDISVELNTSDSTAGIQNTIDGTCDIGMASRDLKDTETGITATKIAIDGIAVIVNNENTLDDITPDNVMKIYTGAITSWDDVK